MPYKIIPILNKNGKGKAQSSTIARCFQVRNIETGRITANCTSKEKAEKQVRLLTGLETGGRGTDPEVILQMKQMMQEAKKKKQS